jgi:hypothetical protein
VSGGIPFGNYQLIRRIARGGMAEVFLASQRGPEGFERTVAIKRILPHLADSPEFVAMFMDEARLAARLTHPNVAHIYEFGKVEDDYFIAMEYIDGIDLAPIILAGEQGLLPLAHAARVAADVAAGLNYAHEQKGADGQLLGVVHRDISPQNILVSFDGAVKVVDFGIAKAAHHMERTQPGVIRGKYTYMSPEQVSGKALDGRTDVFCLGIVLCELCTGKVLFSRAEPMKAMTDIRDGSPPDPKRLGKGLPVRLTQIIRKALARDPDKRYANAAEMQLALEAFLHSTSEISNSLVLATYFREHYRTLRPEPKPLATAAAGEGTAAPGRPGTAIPARPPSTAIPAALGGGVGPLGPRGGGTGLAAQPGIGLAESARAARPGPRSASGEHETIIRFRGTDELPVEPGDLEPSELGLEDASESELPLARTRLADSASLEPEERSTVRGRGRQRRPAPRSRPSGEQRRPGPHAVASAEQRLPATDSYHDEGSTSVRVDSFEVRRTISSPGTPPQRKPQSQERGGGRGPTSDDKQGPPASTGPLARWDDEVLAEDTPTHSRKDPVPPVRSDAIALASPSAQLDSSSQPSTQLIAEPPKRSRRRFGVLLAAAILVPLSGVVGYFLAAPGSSDGDPGSHRDLLALGDSRAPARGPEPVSIDARRPAGDSDVATDRGMAGAADATLKPKPPDVGVPARDAGPSKVEPSTGPTGTLFLTTRPRGAWLRVDGKTLERSTPLRWRGAAGAHELVVGRRGYRNVRRKVRLRAKRTTRLSLRLRRAKRARPPRRPPDTPPKAKEPGFISVTTVPWSNVYLGSRKLGMTPLANQKLPAGTHTLRFVNPGAGVTKTRRVRIKSGKVTKLRFRLR